MVGVKGVTHPYHTDGAGGFKVAKFGVRVPCVFFIDAAKIIKRGPTLVVLPPARALFGVGARHGGEV